MKGDLQQQSPQDSNVPAEEMASPCGGPGSFHELSAQEFNRKKDLSVIVLKDDTALDEFRTFNAVHYLPTSKEFYKTFIAWPCERPIGLVCPDGTCSSRLAIRLSRRGFTVYHLSGGLREWHQCTLG